MGSNLSKNQQKNVRIVKIIFIIFAVLALLSMIGLYKFLSTPVRTSKDYSVMYVKENDVLDSEDMINPPEEYSVLLKISSEVRKEVADYLKENNYKLKSGKQEFITNTPTFKELIKDGFVFEPLS